MRRVGAGHAVLLLHLLLTPVACLHPQHQPTSLFRSFLRSWAYQVLHVQRMVNDQPSTALGGMTRSEALYGAPTMCAKLPTAQTLIDLLGFTK